MHIKYYLKAIVCFKQTDDSACSCYSCSLSADIFELKTTSVLDGSKTVIREGFAHYKLGLLTY